MCENPKYAKLYPTKIKLQKNGIEYGNFVESRQIKFQNPMEISDENILNYTQIGCGKCLECRIAKANEWATRCAMKAKAHKKNCFITLTYNNNNLPRFKSLVKKDLQKFFKRLRKQEGEGIRYYACGEYGPTTNRPHYHIVMFGYKPNDIKPFKEVKTDKTEYILYKSKSLQKIWGKGFVTIGELNYQSSAYTARYVQKKAFGEYKSRIIIAEEKKAREWALKNEKNTEMAIIFGNDLREPEFQLMSRRGGIGLYGWKKNKEQIKRNNGILLKIDGKVTLKNLPNFIKKCWKEEDRAEYFKAQDKKQKEMQKQKIKMLEKTSLTPLQYELQRRELKKEKLKRLTRKNCEE